MISTVFIENKKKMGASYSRMEGVKAASNEYILFCDDDEFLGPDYARVCKEKIDNKGASIVSGRHFYRQPNESVSDAIARFGNGISCQNPFDPVRFCLNNNAVFEGDIEVPFTHGIYMARKSLLFTYGLDPYYSKGNGFREESDVQARAFLDGNKIVLTNDAHAVHLNWSEVRSGGQRVNRLKRYYWTVFYTNYFLSKYFDGFKKALCIPYTRSTAMLIYAVLEFYMFFMRPFVILPSRVLQLFSR